VHLTDEAIDCHLAPLVISPLRKAQLHGYCVALGRNPLVAIEPALQRCQAPLRVVWGTGDMIFDRSGPDWLDRTFPQEMPDVIAEEARKLRLGA
jgi:hypothetical protein